MPNYSNLDIYEIPDIYLAKLLNKTDWVKAAVAAASVVVY